MKLPVYLPLLSSFLLLGACGPSGNSKEIPASPPPEEGHKLGEGEPAYGQINGQEWTFKSGRAFKLSKHQQNYVVVQLWNEKFADPCNEKVGSTLQVRLTAPFAASTWNIAAEDPFNANISIFFSDSHFHPRPRDNMRADQGEIRFGELNSHEVTGFFTGTFQNPRVGGTNVEGEFSVPFCQP